MRVQLQPLQLNVFTWLPALNFACLGMPHLADELALEIRRMGGADGVREALLLGDASEQSWSDSVPGLLQKYAGAEHQRRHRP